MESSALKKSRRAGESASWGERLDEMLEAAARLFARHGYTETVTQHLADELGVGKGTLYRYFPSKEQLFLAAVDRVMRMLRQRIETDLVGLADPLDQIAAAVRAFLAFFAANPEYVELLMQERAQFRDRKKPTYFEHRECNVERWRELYRGLIAAGRVRKVPVERITDVIGNLLYGTIFTNYFDGPPKAMEDQARDILDIVFHGILSAAEREQRGTA